MTTTTALPSDVARRHPAVIDSPGAAEHLELLAEAIRLAVLPAFFAVWQNGPDSMRLFVDALVQGGLTAPHVLRPDNFGAKLRGLEQKASLLSEDDGIVFLGCLSALREEERSQVNAARDRLLRLPTRMIFVESIADEGKVRLGFPDVLSLVSFDCRLFQRPRDEVTFATSDPCHQEPDANGVAPRLLSGTIDKVREADAICWLEICPGDRVKFAVPLALLHHLNPQPGLELFWSPGKEGETPVFWKREPGPPDPELIREVEERYRRIRDTLRTWQPRLPEDE
jgi:hypothetical protein